MWHVLTLMHTVCVYVCVCGVLLLCLNDTEWVCADVLIMYTGDKLLKSEHCPSFFVPADLRWGVCCAVSWPRWSLSGNKTHSTSHPSPVVSHRDRDVICHSMTYFPQRKPASLKLVKQRQMRLCLKLWDNILVRKPSSHGKVRFDNCHSISPFRVWSHNESRFYWSVFTERRASALRGIWNKVVRQLSGSLACAHSRGLVLVACAKAVCVPRLSFDEGRQWNKYSFTNTPLFVDGVLGEPGEETLIMTWVTENCQVGILSITWKIKVTTIVCVCRGGCALICLYPCISIWACLIQHSWLPVFLFMNKKKILSRSTQHQNWLSPDYDHRRSMLWQPATAWLSIWRTWRQTIKKNAWENRQETLVLKKVLTAFKSGKSS